jgi:hypothetical protein
MGRGIQLTRSSIKDANHWFLRGFRLRIEVTEVTGGMPEHVFVYRREPANPETGTIDDTFQTVASLPDLSEYPVGAPDPERPFPYFRDNFIEVDVRSTGDFQNVWERIHAEVCNLVDILNRADNLVVDEVVWCGDQPPTSESASESASESESN